MIKLKQKSTHLISVGFLFIITLSSIFTILPLTNINSGIINEESKRDNLNAPSLNTIGAAEWWNRTFEYRKLINITNPHNEAFTDFIAKIEFNYTELVIQGNLNNSLKDIRIIENGEIRNYYIAQDFPNTDLATVWFETNISASQLEQDTYMYYGNEDVDFASSYLILNNPDGFLWYKFEEIVNGEVIDYQGNHNATVNGAVLDANSAVGANALSFDGSNDYLAIQDHYYNTRNGLTEFTVCAFFKTPGTGSYSNNWAIFDYDRSEHFNFYVRGDGGLGFSSFAYGWDETSNWDPNEDPYSDNNYDDFNTATNGFNDDQWHFGAALYDGTDKVLYIDDGVEDARNDNAHNGLGIGDSTLRYGIIGDGSEASSEGTPRNNIYYNGELDEIRYFEYALSAKRIEWIAKNYNLVSVLNEEQEKRASIVIIAKDIDGRAVPGLEIYMYNKDFPTQESYSDITGEQGYLEFPNVNRTEYIITANYSISTGAQTFEEIVYNSSDYGITNDFSGDFHTVYLNASLWSIDFEIEDWNEDPMGYGYVLVYNRSDYTELIANITLNKNTGTQTFRWSNISQDAAYYYEIYYDNEDYVQQHNLVNRSLVNRSVYLNTNLHVVPTLLVNETNIHTATIQKYAVEERVYATGSDLNDVGNIKLINTTITLNNMADDLDKLDIYYIDINNNVSTNPIYSEEYTTETSDIIELDISELAEAYGLLIYIEGTNATNNCNGTIDVSYTETFNHYVKANMSKLDINVFDDKGNWDPTFGNVYVKIINGTGVGEEIVTLLTTDQGDAKGVKNTDLSFWYYRGTLYNITLIYGSIPRQFNASSNQYTTPPGVFLDHFNYTLDTFSTIELRIRLSLADFKTEFQDLVTEGTKEWGLDFSFSVRFMSTENATSPSPTWDPVSAPDFVNWEITDLLGDSVFDSGAMDDEGNGYYNYTINSGFLIGGEQYYFAVYGEKTGYQDPARVQMLFTVSSKATTLSVVNSSDLSSLGSNLTQYFGEEVNLTILYDSYSVLLEEATVTYDWQFIDDPIVVNETPAGYYSFTLDTSNGDVGTYQVRISAVKENYTSIQDFRFDIIIINRPTSLNGSISLFHIPETIWVRQSHNFTFAYIDILSEPNVNVGNLDQAYYQWYEVAANGSIIGDISSNIDLIEGQGSTYILDFDTASKNVGNYALFITMQKNNYEVRTALIDLTIKKRIMTLDLTATNLIQSQIRIDQGHSVVFELSLTDLTVSTDPQSITDATVVLTIGSTPYVLTGANGTYTYTFPTSNINTFFAQQVFSGEISITRDDYVSESISFTIIVQMLEIFPGFPLFYFIMLVSSIAAIIGSLTVYRLIQVSRIPTFVKKARKMKKEIKGKKSISESLLYPSKEEYIVKQLGDKWNVLGLSLKEILGIEDKKKRELTKLPVKEDKVKKKKTPDSASNIDEPKEGDSSCIK
jgi:hypothetical protein